ncbi:MAG: hypothetical protein AAF633_26825 [Chloroflexota bacterium]
MNNYYAQVAKENRSFLVRNSMSQMVRGFAMTGFILFNSAIVIVGLAYFAMLATVMDLGDLGVLHSEAITTYGEALSDYVDAGLAGTNDVVTDFTDPPALADSNQ